MNYSLLPVSFVTTVFNEASNIAGLLDSLFQAKYRPAQFILVDAGSTDDTLNIVEKYSLNYSDIEFTILCYPGVNIARGRNIAINKALHEVIAVSDAGCVLSDNWLCEITEPILNGNSTHVAGWYYPLVENAFQKRLAKYLFPKLPDDPNKFLPSSRSIAFTKAVWSSVNGYPEQLSFAGEDTLFDVEIVSKFGAFYFNQKASVGWWPVRDRRELVQKYYRYGVGEGEAGLFKIKAILRLLLIILPLDLFFKTLSFSSFCDLYLIRSVVTLGYIKGFFSKRD